jgi:outer membrane lipoprotein carrier protein
LENTRMNIVPDARRPCDASQRYAPHRLLAHRRPRRRARSLEAFVKTRAAAAPTSPRWSPRPAREGQAARTKTSTGTFEFSRPNRFRFDYRKPFVQTIVADGQTLWLHDVDLNQVTARKQEQVLGATPAAIIAAAPDLSSLKRDFDLQALPDRDGLQWVQATPKAKDGQLNGVKVGFRGNDLAALEILDSFGQRR